MTHTFFSVLAAGTALVPRGSLIAAVMLGLIALDPPAALGGTPEPPPQPTAISDDPLFKLGEKTFRTSCQACHQIDKPATRVGPHLVGIFGRPAAALDNYKFSKALQHSGVVWNEETLKDFLRDGQAFVPGNRMTSPAIRNAETLTALLHYLKVAGTPSGQ